MSIITEEEKLIENAIVQRKLKKISPPANTKLVSGWFWQSWGRWERIIKCPQFISHRLIRKENHVVVFLQYCSHQYWMGSTNLLIFIALSFCCQLARQHQEEKCWECRDLNPGRLGVERERDLCAMAAPQGEPCLKVNSPSYIKSFSMPCFL